MSPLTRPPRHIIFSASAAGVVARALRAAGIDDQVMCAGEELLCGPIHDIRGAARRAWIAEHLGWTYAEFFDSAAQAWDAATSSSVLPVAWVTRHDARDLAGYLEFVSQIGSTPFDVVDVPRLLFPRAGGSGTFELKHLALVPPENIVAARLWHSRGKPAPEQVGRDRALWRKLKAENAPLRVMREGVLVSAPITHYDDVVLACTNATWQVGARVVGETMGELFGREQLIGDAFLWGRVRALARQGVLEIDGDASDMRDTKVRRM